MRTLPGYQANPPYALSINDKVIVHAPEKVRDAYPLPGYLAGKGQICDPEPRCLSGSDCTGPISDPMFHHLSGSGCTGPMNQ